ncbi:MAG: recombinase family protein, partial [Phycisphaerales bacterium]
MEKDKKIPAVGYLRRSTDKQEQSLEDQKREIGHYASQHGYKIIREYIDDAISGTSADKRPAFQSMVTDAAAGDFKAVIVWNSDRFSRGDVTETEHYRYLLRRSGVKVLSVTEDYLSREGIDGDVLRTVKQFQNRQFSISLSQNTLRGQVSAILAESDPGRTPPYGYDREIIGPDGSLLYRIRFCENGIREVYDKQGRFQAKYIKGQSLHKPGKECKARLTLSSPDRIDVVKDIFRMCLDGVGFKGIADKLNAKGMASPQGNSWSFTTIKALLENPAYQGDLVWNRRTESKFYAIENGRAMRTKREDESSRSLKTSKDDWVTVRDVIPPIVSRQDWLKVQNFVLKRHLAKGGHGHQTRRWLLSGVLVCGDCNTSFWGERKHKGHIEGRKDIISYYYTCAGRRRYGKNTCSFPSHIKAKALESWVLKKLSNLVLGDKDSVEEAINHFIKILTNEKLDNEKSDRIAQELKQINETINAIVGTIDPANLPMLNDRLTQLRLRKEYLQNEENMTKNENQTIDKESIRKWAKDMIVGLENAIEGQRDEAIRKIMSRYIEKIKIWPSNKTGELILNPKVL